MMLNYADIRVVLAYIATFLITIALLISLRRLAPKIGLLDFPGGHREHRGAIPLVGGLAMFCGFLFGVLLLPIPLSDLRALFAASALLVIVGVLDDLHELSSRSRFTAQIIAALLMVYWGRNELTELGSLFYIGGQATLGILAMPLTVFSTVGVINALNMSDGIDGLAGSLTIVSVVGLLVVTAVSGDFYTFHILAVLACAVVAFLIMNVRIWRRVRALVFMGDAGSMFLGFVLTWFFVETTQGQDRVITPVTAIWMMAIPLFDTISVMLRRMIKLKSPFQADRYHIHHLLRALGMSDKISLRVLAIAAGIFCGVGIWGYYEKVPEWYMFYGYLGIFVGYFLATNCIWYALGLYTDNASPVDSCGVIRRCLVIGSLETRKDGRKERRHDAKDRRKGERRVGGDRRVGAIDRRKVK